MAVPVFRNISLSLIFAVREESAKTTKIMCLENLVLYGSLIPRLSASISVEHAIEWNHSFNILYHSFFLSFSGISLETLQRLVDALNGQSVTNIIATTRSSINHAPYCITVLGLPNLYYCDA